MNARQKSLFTLLAVAAVAGGLALYAYFGVMKPREQEAATRQDNPALFPGARSEPTAADAGSAPELVFTTISIQSPEARLVLEPREGLWRITSPVDARAKRQPVLDLIAELKHATLSQPLSEQPTDEELERYGLKPPRATVAARGYLPDAQGGGAGDASRQRSVTFELGIENVFDGSVYVRREGDPRVHFTHGALRILVDANIDVWRDNVLFNVDAASLLRVEIERREGPLVLERATTDKPWRMARPLVMRADDQRVARIFSDLKLYNGIGYPPPEWEAQVQRALDKPQVSATLVTKLGGPLHIQLVTLKLDGFERTFARSDVPGETVVAQVDDSTLKVLSPPALDFKSKKVLEVQVGAVAKFVIHPGNKGEEIVVERLPETDRWEVVAPTPGRAREFKVASLLSGLEKLEAEEVVATGPKSWASHGLNDTSRGITLLDEGGQELARLRLGKAVPGNDKRTWARGSSEDVYALSDESLAALPLKLEDLLDQGPGNTP